MQDTHRIAFLIPVPAGIAAVICEVRVTYSAERSQPAVFQPLMIALAVIVRHVMAGRTVQRCLPKKIIRLKHSCLIERTNLSEKAFKLCARGGSRMPGYPRTFH
jgi:hypothetical protein